MRIIRGKHQRRQITAPSNLPVRPTTDMAKESLFNILENHFDFEEIIALDLFAGTGNISYELVSRGCPRVTAVDENNNCVKVHTRYGQQVEHGRVACYTLRRLPFHTYAQDEIRPHICRPSIR